MKYYSAMPKDLKKKYQQEILEKAELDSKEKPRPDGPAYGKRVVKMRYQHK